MIFVIFGDSLLPKLGMPIPGWLQHAQENKFMTFAMLFLFNNVAHNMASTGAFEVSLNGQVLFSKLESGRMPRVEELVTSLTAMGLTRS
mmetsp:Transcript_994/g.1803  ORF Transcript_994/g.1803 Transcript_994/m.1803 type:complete len:89 (+) Transcript_994:578-844(+)